MALSKKVKIKLELDSRGHKRGAEQAKKAHDEIRSSAKRALTEVNRIPGAFRAGAQGAGSFLRSADKLGDGLRNTYDAVRLVADGFVTIAEKATLSQVAIDNLPFSINRARGATMGLVDDLTLQQQAITASRLNVTQSEADFARLAGAATKLGLSVGQDATKSVQDLTTALARQSPMILDNLGITLKVSEANQEYARRIGKVASELTDAERKQAFMTIGLERAEEAAAKVNVELDQSAQFLLELRTNAQNAGNYLARGFVGSLTNASNALEDFLGDVTGLNDELADLDAANGGRQFSFFNPNFAQNVERAKELARTRKEQAEDARLEAEIAAEIALQEKQTLETQLNSVKLQIAGTTNQRELNKLLTKEASLRSLLLDIEGKGAESERVLFQDLLRQRRFRAQQRNNGDRFAVARKAFEAELRVAEQARATAEFAAQADRGRLVARQDFNDELARTQSLQAIEGDRLRAANDALQRRNELQQADLQRQIQLAEVQGNPAEAFALEQQEFAIREENLRRRLELETEVGERERIEEELAQARHDRTISRIREEQRAREELAARQAKILAETQVFSRNTIGLSKAVADASIKDGGRREKALRALAAGELWLDGTVYAIKAAGAFAGQNYLQGLAYAAASAAAFVKSSSLGGRGGGGGSSTAGTATQFARGAPVERAQFNVDRGAPLSVREEIEGNPNNTSNTGSGGNAGNVVQITGPIQVFGKIDDDVGADLRKQLMRSERSLSR